MVKLNKIYCEDAIKFTESLPDDCVDLIITSPPYNYDIEYNGYKDNKTLDDYLCFLYDLFNQCKRVLKKTGRVAINIQADFAKQIPLHHLITNSMCENDYKWWCEIIWNKKRYNTRHSQFGSWLLPSAPCIKISWEYVEIFYLNELKREIRRQDADITKEEFLIYLNGMWDIPPENRTKKFRHPAMFPEELPYRLIKLLTYKNDVIYDPFCGAGTTCVVAKKLGRRFLGCDTSEDYCKISRERLCQKH